MTIFKKKYSNVLFAILLVMFFSVGKVRASEKTFIQTDDLFTKINIVRAENDLPLFIKSEKLDEAATLKGNDMVINNYFAHISPSGISPWSWIIKSGYSYRRAGENLAINFRNSESLIKAWLDSPKHKANILNPLFTEIGYAVVERKHKGYTDEIVVQVFAEPITKISP
jgi:uncharacterized protein YkwD